MINPDVGVSFCCESCHARHPKVGIALIRSYATSADFVISLRLLILRKIVQMFADCQTNPENPQPAGRAFLVPVVVVVLNFGFR